VLYCMQCSMNIYSACWVLPSLTQLRIVSRRFQTINHLLPTARKILSIRIYYTDFLMLRTVSLVHTSPLVYTADKDKTRLSCLVLSVSTVWSGFQWCEQYWRQVKTVSKYVFPIYWVLLKTVLTCCQFCSRCRQDMTVLSCPCRWCKLGIIY